MLHQNSRVFPPGRHTLEFCTTRCSTREYARALRNRGDILWCAVYRVGSGMEAPRLERASRSES